MYRLGKFKKGEVDISDLITGRKGKRWEGRGIKKNGNLSYSSLVP